MSVFFYDTIAYHLITLLFKELFMKQLLLVTALSAIALTGCNSLQSPFKKADSQPVVAHEKADGEHHGKGHHDRHGKPMHHKHHDDVTFQYKCEQKAHLEVEYDSEDEMADIEITAPTLGLIDQDIQLKLAPSASGERYINDTNPASLYEWHAKGGEGIFSVTVNEKEYSLSCTAVKPANHP